MKSSPELAGDQTTGMILSGDPAADRALWSLAVILDEIASTQVETLIEGEDNSRYTDP
ncbi:MAG: hypothetical protein HQ553_09460 [Chloroflexi bacterium]|nr:hypothetical protein [Chloroflexota bacterium]